MPVMMAARNARRNPKVTGVLPHRIRNIVCNVDDVIAIRLANVNVHLLEPAKQEQPIMPTVRDDS
jgi:hypothetical protein